MSTFPRSASPRILLYHKITPVDVDNQLLSVTPDNFEEHLQILTRHYNPLSLELFLYNLEHDLSTPDSVAVTFDDGYADNLLNSLPLLEKYKIPATFFITANFIDSPTGFWGDIFEDVFLTGRPLPPVFCVPSLDFCLPCISSEDRLRTHDAIRRRLKYEATPQDRDLHMQAILEWAGLPSDHPGRHRMMRSDEVRELASSPLVSIGAHCMTHNRLALLSEQDQRWEITESCRYLEKAVGQPIQFLAYPFGSPSDYNDTTRAIVAQENLYAFSTTPLPATKEHLPAEIPRYLVRNWSGSEFSAWLEASHDTQRTYEQDALNKRANRVRPGKTLPFTRSRNARTDSFSVTYINTHCGTGGAATSTERLGHTVGMRGHKTRAITGNRFSPRNEHYQVFSPQAPAGLDWLCNKKGLLDYAIQGSHSLHLHPFFREADIIHYQNLHGGYFNLWSLPLLSQIKPSVWTLRDMQALTGHCAHAFDCEKWQWQNGCDNCPDLHVYPAIRKDATRQLWSDKKCIYEHSQLWIVVPSTWMLEKAQKSILRHHPMTLIPNAADTKTFTPHDKLLCRRLFGLPEDAILIGASADDGALNNPWKGGKYALEAIQGLSKRFSNLYFVNIGGSKATPQYLPNIINIPYESQSENLAKIYSALDLFLYPTLADTAPLVAIEALSCGVPIAAFATGGVPDVVRHEIDGLLVPPKNTQELIEAASELLSAPEKRHTMRLAARQGSVERFDWHLMAARYEEVYAEAHLRFSRRKSRRIPTARIPALILTKEYCRSEEETLGMRPRKERLLMILPRQIHAAAVRSFFSIALRAKSGLRNKYLYLKTYCNYSGTSKLGFLKKLCATFLQGGFFINQKTEPLNRVFGLNCGRSISRYYIDSFIDTHKSDIRGTVLEIGFPTYTTKYNESIIERDVLHAVPNENKDATIIDDLASGKNIPTALYDCILLTQTLPYIYDIQSALENSYRALKDRGVLLVTSSGICQISQYDMIRWGDYWRTTDLCMKNMIESTCQNAEYTVTTYGNLASSIGLLRGVHAEKYKKKILDHQDNDYQIIVAARICKGKHM